MLCCPTLSNLYWQLTNDTQMIWTYLFKRFRAMSSTCLLLKRSRGLSNTSKPFGRSGESSNAWQWILFTTSFFGLSTEKICKELIYTKYKPAISTVAATEASYFALKINNHLFQQGKQCSHCGKSIVLLQYYYYFWRVFPGQFFQSYSRRGQVPQQWTFANCYRRIFTLSCRLYNNV